MKSMNLTGILVLFAGVACGSALAQTPAQPQSPDAVPPSADSAATAVAPAPVVLEWTPAALAELNPLATTKSSFSLDRSMLTAASSLLPETDRETRQAIAKIDGISIHMLRFGPAGLSDETPVAAIRDAYRQRGWKHLVSTTGSGGPIHDGTTDLWLAMEGVNVRGAVALVETSRSLTLVTLAGNLSPVDVLHLRGHFGIPRFEGDGFKDARDNSRDK
jgi:hypothetical protein